jgi:hypothetical protein
MKSNVNLYFNKQCIKRNFNTITGKSQNSEQETSPATTFKNKKIKKLRFKDEPIFLRTKNRRLTWNHIRQAEVSEIIG